MATAVVVGTVIGSGVFFKPHAIAQSVKPTGLVALVWLLGGALALLGSLAYAEITVLYPRAGGNYVFLREGYGRLAAFLWGWVEFWIIRGGSLAALATVFAQSFHGALRAAWGPSDGGPLLGDWPLRLLTVAVILVLALVNVRGVRWGGVMQLVITTVKVGSLLAILALPFLILLLAPSGGDLVSTTNLEPVGPEVWNGGLLTSFGVAMLGCLWAYHGWMNIGPVAEEIQRPARNVPLALFAGVGTIIFLYLGANLAYSLVLSQDELAQTKNKEVVLVFGRILLGPAGAAAASAAVMCSVFGALNGILLTAPRLLYAMGEDHLAPRALGRVHPTFRTPAVAILLMAGWACVLVLAVATLIDLGWLEPDRDIFDRLTDFAIFGSLTFETLALTTIFIFRIRRPEAERPYRCWGYPVVPALYVLIMAGVLANMFYSKSLEALIGLGFILVGVGAYLVWERHWGRQEA
jgi:amino acid transporter